MQLARHNRRGRTALYALLTAILGIVSITLVQCTMVGDRTTGVQFFKNNANTCIKDCNDRYKVLFDQEQQLHHANVENCQALPPPDRGDCLAAEGARHAARMAELSQGKIDCQNNCHDQGGDTGD
jgi:hypothetical protein